MICAKYDMSTNSWVPSMEIDRKVSTVWKDIMQIQHSNPLSFEKFSENCRISVGNGNAIQFWNDPWVNGKSLAKLYPRIASIISLKDESLAEVWLRKEELFRWEFQLRRNLFVWEEEELDSLITLLDGIQINIQMSPDHLSWNACSSKSYSVSSMYNLSLIPVSIVEINDRKTFKWIWDNVAPFRVQCFTWMVKLGKIKTGDFLLSVGIIQQQQQALCKFCGVWMESINHSFLHCPSVWSVWCLLLDWWGTQWVTPSNVDSLFLWWRSCRIKNNLRMIWNCIPLATLWSIWKMRNEFIFQNKGLNWEELADLIKLRVAFWVKSKWKHGEYSVNDFIFRLKSIKEAV